MAAVSTSLQTADPVSLLAAAAAAAVLSGTGIAALLRLLRRHALAHPNHRSSHVTPTPQGAGFAIVLAAIAIIATLDGLAITPPMPRPHALFVLGGALLLAIGGLIDDIRNLPIVPRFAIQFIAIGALIATAPPEWRILGDAVPLPAERALIALAGLWFINLVNFMDGIDLITIAELAPVTAGLALLAGLGLAPAWIGFSAAALFGALIAFAPFNHSPAIVFLGDAGSLALGALVGWLLFALAANGGLIAALILPLYYLFDASVTLIQRAFRGEKVWQAHRSHFYQRATVHGHSVPEVSLLVFALNVILVGLALAAAMTPAISLQVVLLVLAMALVIAVLVRFGTDRNAG